MAYLGDPHTVRHLDRRPLCLQKLLEELHSAYTPEQHLQGDGV